MSTFHDERLETLTPYFDAMAAEESPLATLWKASQLPTMHGCMGVGVPIPLPAEVIEAGTGEVCVGPAVLVLTGGSSATSTQ